MNNNLSLSITVNNNIHSVFEQIQNFKGWWSEAIEGRTDVLNETFFYHHKDVHLSRIRLIELVPDKLIRYEVVENQFNFTKDKREWTGTFLVFELNQDGDKTQVNFTHQGLTPHEECFNICSEAWTFYIQTSLKEYLESGKGRPNPLEEEGFNNEIVKKWKLSETN